MKNKKLKGYSAIIVAIIVCCVFAYRRGNDKYFVNFTQTQFRQVSLSEYSDDNTALLEYVPQSESTITCFTKGALSLQPGEYSIDFQYAANDDTSVFKVFASDYVSSDNSGGKIFVQQDIDPNASAIKTTFTLDQKVDSLFITVETKDPSLSIGRVTFSSKEPVYTDTYFYCIIVIFSALVVFLLLNIKNNKVKPVSFYNTEVSSQKSALMFVFIMACAIFMASIPLLNEGLLTGHDLPFHMGRIEGIARGLESGQFPVRIHGGTLNDYGYPNSLFYPELLLYIPAILSLLGVSIMTSYKFYIIFINALTIILSYFAFKKFTKSRSIGLTLSILYLLNPYRLICCYYRAAIGEFTAITFLPLVLYGLYAILLDNKKDWPYLVVGATGVLQSHFLSTELTALLAAVMVLIFVKNLFTKEKRYLSLIYATVSTVLLNIWFLGPMLLMMKQLGLFVFTIQQSPYGFARLDVSHLFVTGSLHVIGPHPIGWISLFSLTLYIIYRICYEKTQENDILCKIGDSLAWISIILTIGTTAYFPWDIISQIPVIGTVISAIQFPYRLLSLSQVCMVTLTGIVIFLWIKHRSTRTIACVLCACLSIFLTSLFYEFAFVREEAETIQNKHYFTNNIDNQLSVGQAEYLVEGANLDDMVSNLAVLESDNSSFSVTDFKRYGTKTSFSYSMDFAQGKENMIVLPYTYIPNYVIKVDSNRVYPVKYKGGKVAFSAPDAQGKVTVEYKEPLTFRAFELISLITFAGMIFYKRIIRIFNKSKKIK